MEKVGINFDEMKPHHLENGVYREEAERLGMKNVRFTGDYDMKIATIVGEVESFSEFAEKFKDSPLSKTGSISRYW